MAVDGKDAAREAEAMRVEGEDNMAAARIGQPANYRPDARFVLKLLPDMDRDKAKVDQRIEASLAQGRKPRRLTRHEIPPGTAGYLYAQARAFLAGVENLSREKSAISLSDFEYGEPQVVGVEKSPADGTLRVTGSVPVAHRNPSGRELMARMGTALGSGNGRGLRLRGWNEGDPRHAAGRGREDARPAEALQGTAGRQPRAH